MPYLNPGSASSLLNNGSNTAYTCFSTNDANSQAYQYIAYVGATKPEQLQWNNSAYQNMSSCCEQHQGVFQPEANCGLMCMFNTNKTQDVFSWWLSCGQAAGFRSSVQLFNRSEEVKNTSVGGRVSVTSVVLLSGVLLSSMFALL